jgi:transketolase
MPSWELFEQQPEAYRTSVLPPAVSARVAIEAGRTLGWERYVGERGSVVGVDRFGASAPGPEVAARLGLTPETIVRRAHDILER